VHHSTAAQPATECPPANSLAPMHFVCGLHAQILLTWPIMAYVGRQPINVLGRATPTTENMRAERRPAVSPAQIHAQRTRLNRPARVVQCDRLPVSKCGCLVIEMTAEIMTEATGSVMVTAVHLPSQPNMTAPNGLLMKPRPNMLLCRASRPNKSEVQRNTSCCTHIQDAGTCNLTTLW